MMFRCGGRPLYDAHLRRPPAGAWPFGRLFHRLDPDYLARQQFDAWGQRRNEGLSVARCRRPAPTSVFHLVVTMIAMLAIHRHGAIIDSNLDGGTYGKSSGA